MLARRALMLSGRVARIARHMEATPVFLAAARPERLEAGGTGILGSVASFVTTPAAEDRSGGATHGTGEEHKSHSAHARGTLHAHGAGTPESVAAEDASSSSSSSSPSASLPSAVPSGPESFIDRVKRLGANAMLGVFMNTGKRFDRTLDGMKVTRIGDGYVECELLVTEAVQNSYSTLHGGATCTLVDVVGTMAALTRDPMRAGVSVDINVSFASAAKAGDTVRCEGRVLKQGKRLAFTQVDIYRKSDNTLIATGRHTKAL